MGESRECSVLFRVAGGPEIGFGHLRRCWTLAAQLTEDRVDVEFVAASPEAGGILAGAGFSVSIESDSDSLDQTLRLLQQASPPMVCVVDDPALPSDGLLALRQFAPVVCVDDTADRFFPVELVVNGSAGAETLPYRGASDTCYLLGPKYILLRKSFSLEPQRSDPSPRVRRVMVLTGGGEAGTLARGIATVIMELLPEVLVDVVTGPFGTPPIFDGSGLSRVTLHTSSDDLRSLMLQADVAVSGGGQTAYELAATATATLGIRLAKNQEINLRGLAEAGALRELGSPDDSGFPRRLADALLDLAHDTCARKLMGVCGRRLVDGWGTARVAACLKGLALRAQLPKGVDSCRM